MICFETTAIEVICFRFEYYRPQKKYDEEIESGKRSIANRKNSTNF